MNTLEMHNAPRSLHHDAPKNNSDLINIAQSVPIKQELAPRNVRETIAWLLLLGRPPLPENPIEAAKQGKEPKQPCFFDNRGYFKPLNWKQWQNTQPNQEIIDAWFCHPKTGIGTLGGWNGKHWLGWTDFDQKDFTNAQECDRQIREWMEQYPIAQIAPMFRTPSGGYRFLFAFDKEPENFKANSGFSLKLDGSHHCGELLCKNGGHTLLPPTVGVNGEAYRWVQWSEYPPIFGSPEEIGLYPVVKKTSVKPIVAPMSDPGNGTLNSNSAPRSTGGDRTLSDLLENEIYPILDLQQAFNWGGHDFQQHGDKLKGNCPWHDSQSGTAFYCERKSNAPLWRCPACSIGGSVVEYRHRLKGGNGSPRGREFVELVSELASEVGVPMPERSFRNQQPEDRRSKSESKVILHPTVTGQPLTSEQLLKEVDILINRELPRSELEAIIPELAARALRYPADVWKLYTARVKEQEQALERKEVSHQLPNLLECQNARLNPEELFWGDGGRFAQLMAHTARAMPTSVEALITTLIPAVGSRIGTAARVVIKPSAGYTQPAIFWSCVVAPTGRLKSPAQQAIISPLNKLEAQEYKKWKTEFDEYQIQLKAYSCKRKKDDDIEPPTPPPPRQRFVVQSSTTEARIRIHGENPRGLLNYRDEWSAFVNGRNKYRGGKGDDLEQDLSEFNGDALSKDLVSAENSVYLERSAISRTGNTQPETLKKLQAKQDFEDHAGEFSRWLFCLVAGPAAYIDLFGQDDYVGQQFANDLMRLFEHLGSLPEQDYFLDNEAKAAFQAYQHFLTDSALAENHPGLKATYPKLQSYLARLALWLHLVNAALAGNYSPSQFIDGHTMTVASQMIDFYLAQAKLLYALNSSQQELAGNLLKIKEYVDRYPLGVTVRQIKAGIYSLRSQPSNEIDQDCKTLVQLLAIASHDKKYYPINSAPAVDVVDRSSTASTSPPKRSKADDYVTQKLEIHQSVDLVDELLMFHQHPQPLTTQDIQPIVDVVDEFLHNSTITTGDTSVPEALCRETSGELQKNVVQDFSINNSSTNVETTQHQGFEGVEASSTPHQQTINTSSTIVKTTQHPTVEGVESSSTPHQQNINNINTLVKPAPVIRGGSRVRVHCISTKCHQQLGTVSSIFPAYGKVMAKVKMDDVSLKIFECFIPGSELMRLELID
ncbi:DUF3987 domain-containing protein [Nostoc sp. 2RC]|uniref:DUF3987 domain-containing protein n=1 Tax=Nostoc sp. 2RC TaxID=2485484 RepID=UPI001623C6B0|nr:DUF3987 domain-containing protein [Nostoc sp. 2RC]MBC1235734.1 DUF3987 domain-containing protein [Nostoc sp. 2RC]